MKPDQLPVAYGREGWIHTPSENNMLTLGLPRSGKTSGMGVPHILTALGPVVAVTTQGDTFYEPTAQTRARMANGKAKLWHFNPSGDGPRLPGTIILRTSPLQGAENWDVARRAGRALARTSDAEVKTSAGAFFESWSESVIALVLHGAALASKNMEWVLDVVYSTEGAWNMLEEVIKRGPQRHPKRLISALNNMHPQTRSNVMSSAVPCLEVYSSSAAMASTKSPNFDAAKFAASEGDTIYITGSPASQAQVGPLIVNLLAEIRQAQFELWEQDRQVGREVYNSLGGLPAQRRPPMLWVLDELTSLSRIDRFPKLASTSGGTGLLISALTQSLSQAEEAWGVEGRNLMDVFPCVAIYAGMRDKAFLEQIAALDGRRWVINECRNWSQTEGTSWSKSSSSRHGGTDGYTASGTESQTTGVSEQYNLIDNSVAGDIFQGLVSDIDIEKQRIHRLSAHDHDYTKDTTIIYLEQNRLRAVEPMPYFRTQIHMQMIVGNMAWIADNCRDERARIKIPLIKYADHLDATWLKRYEESFRKIIATRETLELTVCPADEPPDDDEQGEEKAGDSSWR